MEGVCGELLPNPLFLNAEDAEKMNAEDAEEMSTEDAENTLPVRAGSSTCFQKIYQL